MKVYQKIANCKACTLAERMKVCPLCQFYTVQKTEPVKAEKVSNPALSIP